MFYFLTQQIIRQNFKYWALYACLQFDHNIKLIFYSYYAKYVKFENVISFKHININVSKYLTSEHDKNITQKFVLLNDEIITNCIEFVSKLYHRIADWWIRIKNRNQVTNNHIHDFKKIYIKKNKILFENFVFALCRREKIQISRSKIFHNLTINDNQTIRKMVLSWDVKINENDQKMNNKKFDQWTNIVFVHVFQKTLNFISFDFVNEFDFICFWLLSFT